MVRSQIRWNLSVENEVRGGLKTERKFVRLVSDSSKLLK